MNCPGCSAEYKLDYNFCHNCGTDLKDKSIDNTINSIEKLLAIPDKISSYQMLTIYNTFRAEINNKFKDNDPSRLHLLEEKICHKYIRSICNSDYNIRDMIIVGKKILELNRLPYSREY